MIAHELDLDTHAIEGADGREVRPRSSWPERRSPQYAWQVRKSPAMLLCFLLLWGMSLLLYAPRLWHMAMSGHGIAERIVLALFGLFLVAFWLLATYFASVTLFGLCSRPLSFPDTTSHFDIPMHTDWPDIAILYLVCNDVQEEAAATCVQQDYPGKYHVFLLDDSTQEECRDRIETFHTQYPHCTTLIRRTERRAFKAGNLNHALCGPAAHYPFFVVVDADEQLPVSFLSDAVPHLQNPLVAFVQANHSPNPKQESRFAQDIGPTIQSFYDIHCRPRNRFGLVLFVGHGAIIRRDAWEEVGGFPETVLEDLAFTAALLTKGLRGLFLSELRCVEDFPNTYAQFKRQYERYVIGVTQVLHRFLLPLLASRKASWLEKLDFCLWCSPLYVPAICFLFVLFCTIVMGLVLGQWKILTATLFGHVFHLPVVRIFDEHFALLWTWDFRLFSFLCALAPTFGCLALGVKGELRPVRLIALSTMPYLSTMLVSWRAILGYFLCGRAFSPPTGEAIGKTESSIKQTTARRKTFCGFGFRRAVRYGSASWSGPRDMEVVFAGILGAVALLSMNIGHAGEAACLLIGAIAETRGWDSRFVRRASLFCFIAITIQMVLCTMPFGRIPGLSPMMFSVHF